MTSHCCGLLQGSACPYAHGVYERNLHPSKYRTQMCTETGHCSRKVCFFAHETWQLRAPTHVWTVEAAVCPAILLFVLIHGRSGLISSLSANDATISLCIFTKQYADGLLVLTVMGSPVLMPKIARGVTENVDIHRFLLAVLAISGTTGPICLRTSVFESPSYFVCCNVQQNLKQELRFYADSFRA